MGGNHFRFSPMFSRIEHQVVGIFFFRGLCSWRTCQAVRPRGRLAFGLQPKISMLSKRILSKKKFQETGHLRELAVQETLGGDMLREKRSLVKILELCFQERDRNV